MSAHTEVQIIRQDGKPMFAVVPYDEWVELTGQDEALIPHEVVGLWLKENLSLIAAWRKYRKLNQKQLAEKLGISQPALAQMEKRGANLKPETLERFAEALEVTLEQITEG